MATTATPPPAQPVPDSTKAVQDDDAMDIDPPDITASPAAAPEPAAAPAPQVVPEPAAAPASTPAEPTPAAADPPKPSEPVNIQPKPSPIVPTPAEPTPNTTPSTSTGPTPSTSNPTSGAPTPAEPSSSKPGPSSADKGKSRASPPPWTRPETSKAAEEPTPKEEEEAVPDVDLASLGDGSHLTVAQLNKLLDEAKALKDKGNKNYTSKPAKLAPAIADYNEALRRLPTAPYHLPLPSIDDLLAGDRFREVSDDEANQIEADYAAGSERVAVELAIRDLTRALYGNLGAVYAMQHKDPETVEACTKALAFDPKYTKALQRRAAANERIGTWTALASAQRDLELLTTLLPSDSTQQEGIRKSLKALPARIRKAEEADKNDVLGKLQNLGTDP